MAIGFAQVLAWGGENIASLIRIILIVTATGIALRGIHVLIPRLRESIALRQRSDDDAQRIRTLSRVIRYVLTVGISVISVLLILGEFGISIAPILGAAGVAGIAVGFGAQSLVKDYFTGFFLLLENQIRHGDVVEAGGKSGVVEELTLRYLRLRDYSGNVHFVPNGNISVVTNMSLNFAYAVIDVGVAYGEDIEQVITVMQRIANELSGDAAYSKRIIDPVEIAGVEQLADSAVIIRCRFRVVPLSQWDVRREYLKRVKQTFDREGIEIPFPHVKLKV